MVALALYQPDIPQNTGTLMRLCACLEIDLHLIHPLGFSLSDKWLKRAGLDYLDQLKRTDHADYTQFSEQAHSRNSRIILATTKGAIPYSQFEFAKNDIILMGRETSGVPEEIHNKVDAAITIPMREGARSLNMAVSASMILGESLRQTNSFPNMKGE